MLSSDRILKVNQRILRGKLFYSFPIFVFMLLTNEPLFAQKREIGGSIGMLNYTGDLHENYILKNNKRAFNAFYRYNFNEALSTRVSATYGKVRGSDSQDYDAVSGARGSSFISNLFELSVSAEYYFFDIVKNSRRKRFSPFIYAGVGMFYFSRPSAINTSSYSNIQPVVPMGVGFKANISSAWSVSIDTGMRKLFFDDLDGISDGDVTVKDFKYGNPYDKDWYYYSGFSICYTIYKIKCPKMPPR